MFFVLLDWAEVTTKDNNDCGNDDPNSSYAANNKDGSCCSGGISILGDSLDRQFRVCKDGPLIMGLDGPQVYVDAEWECGVVLDSHEPPKLCQLIGRHRT